MSPAKASQRSPWRVPVPAFQTQLADLVGNCSGISTVRELLYRLIHAEMAQAPGRQLKRRSILPLTLEELDRMLLEGRAGSADLPVSKIMGPNRAAQVVCDAFSDGLILLFVDEQRCMRLDETIEAGPKTQVMIVRRTMLTG
jgi:hypothetical protein